MPSHTSVTKSWKVICREPSFKKSVILQNYGLHIRTVHPALDPKDLSAFGEKGIASFGFKSASKNVPEETAARGRDRSRSPLKRLDIMN